MRQRHDIKRLAILAGLVFTALSPVSAQAFRIDFADKAAIIHAFGGTSGGLIFRSGTGTQFLSIPSKKGVGGTGKLPGTRRPESLTANTSPVTIIRGNRGTVTVIVPLEALVEGPGIISQGFSVTGEWSVLPEPGDVKLEKVLLTGIVKGGVKLEPPRDNASVQLSGSVVVNPFSIDLKKESVPFVFGATEQRGGGLFGIQVTGGKAVLGVGFTVGNPGGAGLQTFIPFSGISRDVALNQPNLFSISVSLSSTVSARGGHAISHLEELEFKLRPVGQKAVTEPNTLLTLGSGLAGLGWFATRRRY